MAGELQPLDEKFAIVGSDGRPTLYFIQWAQQRQIDITGSITAEQFNELLVQYLAAHLLQESSGIQITPSGNLSDSPTIAADVQEILDQISTTRGTIIHRGLLGWIALAPGPTGYFLQTMGAGADPLWAAGAGGGGGISRLYSAIASVGTPASIVETDLQTYNMAAGLLASDGQSIRITAYGDMAATTRSRTSRLYFGGTIIGTIGPSASAALTRWGLVATIVRRGAAIEVSYCETPVNTTTTSVLKTPLTVNTAGAITVKVTGQSAGAAVANDVTCEQFIVEFLS